MSGACRASVEAGEAEAPRRAEHGGAPIGARVGPVGDRLPTGARPGRLPAGPIMRVVVGEAAGAQGGN